MHQLSAQPVRSVRKHAVDLLRLPARQVHDVRRVIHHVGDFWLCVVQQNLHACEDRPHARLQICDQAVGVLRRAFQLEEQQRQYHHLDHQSDGRNDAEHFEPELHSCPARPAEGRNPVLPTHRKLRTSIGANTLRARLPLPPRSNPFYLRQFPCCAQSIRPRVRVILALSSGRNPCPHPLSSKENRGSLRRISAQTKYQRARQFRCPP